MPGPRRADCRFHAVMLGSRRQDVDNFATGAAMTDAAEMPNIVLFMADQLTAQVLSAWGGRVCRTPNLDRLAARGAVFDRTLCAYPLCAPSRAALMTGRLPSRIGAWDNGAEFPAALPTFAHYLRARGYYTCLSGKMHFVGPDQFHGFEERLTTEIYPADFCWTPDPAGDAGDGGAERFGAGVSSVETIADAGPVARSMQIDYDEDVIHHAVREIYHRARSPDRRPFLLAVSLSQPHDPFVTTPRWWDLYDGAAIDPPRVPPVPPEARDPHSRALHAHYGQDRFPIGPEATLRARRAYYAMVSHVDAMLGQLMAALEACAMAERTVVIFTSDHGEMLGERGMWFKKTLFEPAIHVPLVITGPGIAPGRIATPVSLIDLMPTILDLAGIGAAGLAAPVEGQSLGPFLARGIGAHGPVLAEHLDGGTAAARVMLREGALKLVLSRAYPPMLHDLAADPQEQEDLAADPDWAGTLARMTAKAETLWDLDALDQARRASQRARRLVDAALRSGRRRSWDHLPGPLAQNTGYVRCADRFPEVERRAYLPVSPPASAPGR